MEVPVHAGVVVAAPAELLLVGDRVELLDELAHSVLFLPEPDDVSEPALAGCYIGWRWYLGISRSWGP